jgi:hypothetical protein
MIAESTITRLPLPASSWATVKRIVRAYHAVRDRDVPTVDDVAQLAGVPRPIVSSNNNFLRATGILSSDQKNRLSAAGTRLAVGMSFANGSLVRDALTVIVEGTPELARLVNMVRARSEMSFESFRGELIVLGGTTDSSRGMGFKAVTDMLVESQLIRLEDNSVLPSHVSEPPRVDVDVDRQREEPHERNGRSTTTDTTHRIPLMLGLGRMAFVELPADWTARDLPKLLKLLELTLGEEKD